MSEQISFLALIVALTIGTLNFLYTRRTFRVSHFPALIVDWRLLSEALEDHVSGAILHSSPMYRIVNLSSSVAAGDVRVSLLILQRRHRYFPWFQRRFTYGNKTYPILEPLETLDRQFLDHDQSFEECIATSVPGFLQRVILEGVTSVKLKSGGSMASREFAYYTVNVDMPLSVLFVVEYRAGVADASVQRLEKRKTLRSIKDMHNTANPVLIGWKVD